MLELTKFNYGHATTSNLFAFFMRPYKYAIL